MVQQGETLAQTLTPIYPTTIAAAALASVRTSLAAEYALCQRAFGWTDEVLVAVAETSIAASFADEDTKRALRLRLAAWHASAQTLG